MANLMEVGTACPVDGPLGAGRKSTLIQDVVVGFGLLRAHMDGLRLQRGAANPLDIEACVREIHLQVSINGQDDL